MFTRLFLTLCSMHTGTPWQYSSLVVLAVLQSVFNLVPSGGESNTGGVCIAPSLTASRKLGAQLVFQVVVLMSFGVVYCAHSALWRSRLHARLGEERRPTKELYIAAVIRFLTIAYTTLALVPLQMLQCVRVNDRLGRGYSGSRFEAAKLTLYSLLSGEYGGTTGRSSALQGSSRWRWWRCLCCVWCRWVWHA